MRSSATPGAMDETIAAIRHWLEDVKANDNDETWDEIAAEGEEHVIYLLAALDAATERAERAERELTPFECEIVNHAEAWLHEESDDDDWAGAEIAMVHDLLMLVKRAYATPASPTATE